MFSGYGSISPFTPDTRKPIAWLRSQRVQRVGEGPTLSMHFSNYAVSQKCRTLFGMYLCRAVGISIMSRYFSKKGKLAHLEVYNSVAGGFNPLTLACETTFTFS